MFVQVSLSGKLAKARHALKRHSDVKGVTFTQNWPVCGRAATFSLFLSLWHAHAHMRASHTHTHARAPGVYND